MQCISGLRKELEITAKAPKNEQSILNLLNLWQKLM